MLQSINQPQFLVWGEGPPQKIPLPWVPIFVNRPWRKVVAEISPLGTAFKRLVFYNFIEIFCWALSDKKKLRCHIILIQRTNETKYHLFFYLKYFNVHYLISLLEEFIFLTTHALRPRGSNNPKRWFQGERKVHFCNRSGPCYKSGFIRHFCISRSR